MIREKNKHLKNSMKNAAVADNMIQMSTILSLKLLIQLRLNYFDKKMAEELNNN